MKTHSPWVSALLLVLLLKLPFSDLQAGEIPAVPPRLPPMMMSKLQLDWGNDFLGRFGRSDDFRTQQVSLFIRLADRWSLTADHSTLTYRGSNRFDPDPVGTEGRLDQLSGSLGYLLHRSRDSASQLDISSGLGFRASGNIAGDRIQNGFHQLIDSGLVNLPYVDTERVDGLIWLRGNFQYLESRATPNWLRWVGTGWQGGYWLYATTLATTDTQWDGAVNASGLVVNGPWKLWLGLRTDWREGYERDVVQTATATATATSEEGVSLSLGVAFGPVIVETTQSLGDGHSAGRIVFNASPAAGVSLSDKHRGVGVQLGILIPEVYFDFQGRWLLRELNSSSILGGQLYSIFNIRYGEPPAGDLATVFVSTTQLTLGGEWQTQINDGGAPWIKPYFALGLGWRREQVIGGEELQGLKSDAVDRAVIATDTGLRFDVAGNRRSWFFSCS
ncbi:MAG: hypothetical protein GY807_03045 [Gammaproteobacteria bacterium]|nr:hypothetical protein [Gammaproteobacteria bacterium]